MMKTFKTRISPELARTILDRAEGHYREILQFAGVEAKQLKNPNQKCPWCGGKDRFSFTDKFGKGDGYCRHCGYHSGVDYLMVFRNLTYRDALKFIADYFCIPFCEEKIVVVRPSSFTRRKEDVERLWHSAHPIGHEDCAYAYLRARGLRGEIPAALRAVNSMRYAQPAENGLEWESSYHAGLIAEISDADGKRVNLHRTYLDGSKKANVKTAKKVLSKELSGCSIRLGNFGSDGVLGLAEGIETALSAAELFRVPVWSVVSAFNFKNFVPPQGVKKLILFADADQNFVGQKEAYAGAASLKQRFPELEVEVRIPDIAGGGDWNDVLLLKQKKKDSFSA